MKRLSLLLLLALTGCGYATEKAKKAAHKGGELAAEAGSEFADGVSKGIQNTYHNEVVVAPGLAARIEVGKTTVSSADNGADNVLTAYFIFHQDVRQVVTAKLFDAQGQEYGRTVASVEGLQGHAQHIEFVFDRKTAIGSRGKVIFD